MQLTVVGCSGSVPGPEAACSAYLVQQDGFSLLLDIGTGAAGPLQRYIDPVDVDAVVISHAHGDHWSGLPDLGYLRTRHDLARGTARPLTVIAPESLPDVVWTNPDVFDARPARPGPAQLGPLHLRLAAVEHIPHSFATRVGDALCYTGDTGPCDAVDDLAAGCQVVLAEASGCDGEGAASAEDPDGSGPARHLTAGDAGRLATRSGAGLLVLTHLRPWHDRRRLLAEAQQHARCPVVLASPGLTLSAGGQARATSAKLRRTSLV